MSFGESKHTTNVESRKYEIAYVIMDYPSLSHTFVAREVQQLQRHGLRIHFYSFQRVEEGQQQPQYADIRAGVTCLPRWREVDWFSTLIVHLWYFLKFPVQYVRILVYVIRKRNRQHRHAFFAAPFLIRSLLARPTVKHVHAYFADKEASFALIVHQFVGLPFSLAAHSYDVLTSPEILPDKIRAADFVVAISEYNRQVIIERCGPEVTNKVHVIRCGLDPKEFESIRLARHATSSREVNSPVSILTVARLAPKKGHFYLIEALALLKMKGQKFHWTVAGDGPSRETLVRLVHERGIQAQVTFVGGVKSPQVKDLLRQTDIFVLPCVWATSVMVDGIPVALMEAMAAGVPVISTTVSGIPELITHRVDGFLVPPENAEELALAIQVLSDDNDLRERFTRNGAQKIAEEYALDQNVQKLAMLFEASLSNVRNRADRNTTF